MIDHRLNVLQVAQSRGRLSSVVGSVFNRWGPVWEGAVGHGGDVDVQYRIGSITKTLTSVLVLQARDAGLLDLDDTVGQHLGAHIGYAECTLRDLLAHTSGMQSEPRGPWWERRRGGDLASLIAAHDGSGRIAPAGAFAHYSNLGFALLGAVVAQVRGHDWRDLIRTDLLEPLAMSRTSCLPRPYAQAGWSVDHFTGIRTLEPLHDTGAMAPAGQLWSTISDLIRWGQFLAGARPDVLSDESRDEMFTSTSPGFGLGVQLGVHTAGVLVGHTGSMPGFLAALAVEPHSGVGAVVLSNATTGIAPWRLVEDLIESDGEGEPPVPWTPTTSLPAAVCGIPGLWFWGNSAHVVRWHNETLEFQSLAVAHDPDVFTLQDGRLIGSRGYHRGETLRVTRDEGGRAVRLECATFVWTTTPYPDGA